jgi:hypothetical protein
MQARSATLESSTSRAVALRRTMWRLRGCIS